MAEESASLADLSKSDSERVVTLRDGRPAIKAVVDEIFGRLLTAAREWPGIYAVESLAEIALGVGDASITDPSLTKVLYKHRLITTPDVPLRRDKIAGGADGLTASIVGSSFCWERGDVRIVCPYQQSPRQF
jgi:hypothetical protein